MTTENIAETTDDLTETPLDQIVTSPTSIQDSEESSLDRMKNVNSILYMIEKQASLGADGEPGTSLDLGQNIVDSYAQERFHRSAMAAVNRANWLTRMWKYDRDTMMQSEFLIHSSLISMLEFDEDIFAFGNCHDKQEYKSFHLFCPYAYRLPDGHTLTKDLSLEYDYLSNTSVWFYEARKTAEQVIENNSTHIIDFHTYGENRSHGHDIQFHLLTLNNSSAREMDEILVVQYEN